LISGVKAGTGTSGGDIANIFKGRTTKALRSAVPFGGTSNLMLFGPTWATGGSNRALIGWGKNVLLGAGGDLRFPGDKS
jgi:hypothetical protein